MKKDSVLENIARSNFIDAPGIFGHPATLFFLITVTTKDGRVYKKSIVMGLRLIQ